MATDAQLSGPLPGAKFTQGRWRQIFGAESAIIGDTDGSAFGLTLPPSTDVAEVGSATLESVALVGGMPLIIPAGETQSIEIPASTNPTIGRTDIIAAQYNAGTFTTAPGPVRLVRIAGTEGSAALPSYSAPLTLPLWAVTRKQGQSLNAATSRDLRARAGWNYDLPNDGLLPKDAPLGSRAVRGGTVSRRDGVGSSVEWVEESAPIETLSGTSAVQAVDGSGWGRNAACRLVRDGKRRWLNLVMSRGGGSDGGNVTSNANSGGIGDLLMAKLHDADKPSVEIAMNGRCKDTSAATYDATGHITATGNLYLSALSPGVTIGPTGPSDTVTFTVSWYVP